MVGMKVRTRDEIRKVIARAKKANIENLGHAGGTIRKVAQHSIKKSPEPSASGTPPHTRRGLLRKSILYAVEKAQNRVVIGPSVRIVGPAGMPHEFGGRFRKERYPKRPFMGPALEQVRERLPKHWEASIR